MARRRLLQIALGGACVLALVGCGEDRGEPGSTVPLPVRTRGGTANVHATATVEVSLIDYRLPRDPRIARAGVIAFEATNDGLSHHALVVDGPAGEVRTPRLLPGERWTIAVRLPPGTYKWYCPVGDHEQRGMAGRVRVAD
jgi:uncharacterized cupredoxin-like copper-binding protein